MKILALDFGLKRTGIATTDDLQLIASGLKAVETKDLILFLSEFFKKNKVECLVVGQPKYMDGKAMDIEVNILLFINHFEKLFPSIPVNRVDERFTSKMAMQSLSLGGAKKKGKVNKMLIDEISATLILQSYLEQKQGLRPF